MVNSMVSGYEEKVNFEVNGQKVVGVLDTPVNPNNSGIVLVHGFKGDKNNYGRYILAAKLMSKKGFHVLRIDCRGTGESDGKFEDMTIHTEVEDVISAVKFLKAKGLSRVGILGRSLGGEVAILASLKEKVDALVLWAPVTSTETWKTHLKPDEKKELQERGIVTRYGDFTGKEFEAKKEFYETAEQIKIENLVQDIACPTLIIQGDKDKTALSEYSNQAYEKITSEKDMKIIKDGDHQLLEHISEVISYSIKWFEKHLKK